ncbi:cytochrome c oxidase subunit II [Novosphingobium sp. G106]|uniref:cytochrome c oxidase subunit II n=1 Tax=Novosphingobium sp. G106 TaxID=2849500 RepID=UPI001C2D6E27|nr:cytochrome c oxidase subunit II [Novosphingobium sp. G106]MBV1691378.1 cytochrome c oxidase subunit II [Novosphingobium sp. G106]
MNRKRGLGAAFALAFLSLSGCDGTPLSYMAGSGSASADTLQWIAWGFSGIAILVTLIIAAMIGLAIRASLRNARKSPDDTVSRVDDGLGFIYWGVGISMPVLITMAVWNFVATRAIAEPGASPRMTVEITGHRWWWEIRYRDADHPDQVVTTANRLVIPTGVPIRIELASADVIHDFWVPKLGPKMDMIPGKTNVTWLEARDAGTYRGQCAEYCGVEHARMALQVTALAPVEYSRWFTAERAPAAPPDTRGRTVFLDHCAACHSVRGTAAAGIYGPDLTHFANRPTIAAGLLPNTAAMRDRWISDTQGVKPGALMPQVALSDADRAAVVRYLGALR